VQKINQVACYWQTGSLSLIMSAEYSPFPRRLGQFIYASKHY
jgi:hypothetical protein